MSFAVGADAYERFMGRYSAPLAGRFADFAGIAAPQRVLDVGCGPGALTLELVRRLGTDSVSAVDPSRPFVAALESRCGGISVQRASAESLPFADRSFDATMAQLVVHFMDDPATGLREMARVTGSGGTVAACVWDQGGGRSPLSAFWDAARALDSEVQDESRRAGTHAGHLGELFAAAGMDAVQQAAVSVEVGHASFEEWWEPYTLGVGPAGAYVRGLSPERRGALRELCRQRLPEAPFAITATAWAARGSPR